MNTRFFILFLGVVAISVGLSDCTSSDEYVSPYPEMQHPKDNPTSAAKVELGRKLFFDKRLSKGNEIACASCHQPEFAFTDRLPRSQGVRGQFTQRNSPGLLNVGYSPTLMFDAHVETLEMQVLVPTQEHTEMDMDMKTLIEKLRAIPEYSQAAKEIFNRDFDAWVLTRALAAFQRSLVSLDSPFDQFYYQNKKSAMSASQKRGWKLFSEDLYCTECHAPPMFTNYEAINNGLYSDYGEDKGRFRIHHDSTDIGKFKVPSLRNVSLTYPYMHNGSLSKLSDVIGHYSKGGNSHKNKDERVVPFDISKDAHIDLLNFLEALTDTSYMKDFR